MKRMWVGVLISVSIGVAIVGHAADEKDPGRPPRAVAAVDALRKDLGAALRGAMEKGGPMAAVEACRDQAPRITVSQASPGVEVGRTSHRLRNPKNAPRPWMEPLLAEYRGLPPAPGSYRVVDLGKGGTGYVEPIYLKPMCATCHGENIEPALHDEIRERYPEDRATGFRPDGFRGLFWTVVAKPR